MMSAQLHLARLLAELEMLAEQPAEARFADASVAWLEEASDAEVQSVLAVLAEGVGQPSAAQDRLLGAAFRRMIRNPALFTDELDGPGVASLVHLYRRLGSGSASRHHLLQWLALRADRALGVFADLVVEDPPAQPTDVLVVFAPIFQRRDFEPALLFPRLLDALAHPGVAASVIDMANYFTREGLVTDHPATDRTERLIKLLGDLAQRLGQFEEQVGVPHPSDLDEADRHARVVEDSVALAISLCDALALIGDPATIGKLYQVLELRHRRLRTEAAAALARFDEQAGVEALVRMAAEPVMRLRVLSYAEELGCLEQIDLQYQTAAARAEGELATWLALPTQFGIPPTRMESVDTRQLYWPGYDDAEDCFLFRFTYRMAEGEYSNIGIAGPCIHAFAADLADLSPDDIYAAFAGWQAEHDDIYETDVIQLTEGAHADVARLERRLRDAGFQDVEPLKMGSFFGEKALLTRCQRDAVAGVAVVDQGAVQWHPEVGNQPIGADLAYCIYKGRKLLRSFNP